MSEASGPPGKLQHWKFLASEVRRKTAAPLQHPTFVIYFFVAVLGIGALGVWAELLGSVSGPGRGVKGMQEVFNTYIPAFVAPTCMQLILAERQKTLRAFSILLTTVCAIALWICLQIATWPGLIFGALSVAGALWLWWLANADQSDFTDGRPDPDAPTGGKVSPNVPLAGSLTDFQT